MTFLKKFLLTIITIKNLDTFFLDFFGLLKKKDVIYNLRNKLKIIARGSSSDTAEIIVINSDFEYPQKYFPRNNRPVIVDVGANIGLFSLYCFNEIKKLNPIIYAIEASLENFKYLEKNIKINNAKNNIKICNLAIYSKDGLGKINKNGDYDSFFVSERITKDDKFEDIELVRLETFCSRNNVKSIDLLKIDIEGGEYDVLQKSIEFIKNSTKSIFIEFHDMGGEKNSKKMINYLKDNNFELIKQIKFNVFFFMNKSNIILQHSS